MKACHSEQSSRYRRFLQSEPDWVSIATRDVLTIRVSVLAHPDAPRARDLPFGIVSQLVIISFLKAHRVSGPVYAASSPAAPRLLTSPPLSCSDREVPTTSAYVLTHLLLVVWLLTQTLSEDFIAKTQLSSIAKRDPAGDPSSLRE